jgi:hypothetical protein
MLLENAIGGMFAAGLRPVMGCWNKSRTLEDNGFAEDSNWQIDGQFRTAQ